MQGPSEQTFLRGLTSEPLYVYCYYLVSMVTHSFNLVLFQFWTSPDLINLVRVAIIEYIQAHLRQIPIGETTIVYYLKPSKNTNFSFHFKVMVNTVTDVIC